jgi:hypothetical protein
MRSNGWLPILLGLAIGLAIGLYYSWVINPIEYTDTAPASLREDFKSDYLTLVASAYASSGDLARAKARLIMFLDPDPASTLSQLAQTRLATGRPQSETQALAQLAAALSDRQIPLASTVISTATFSTSRIQPSSTPTTPPLPPPTKTASPTPGAPFELIDREKVCDADLPGPLIQVEVVDATGRSVPGVEVLVIWDTGQDHFFTGLKPELGVGYGDFTMTEGVTYTLQLIESKTPVTELMTEDCIGDKGELILSSWSLTFQQPEP